MVLLRKIKTNMLKFISFGSGSSGNCYYLYTGTDALMIDAGVGVRTLKKHFYAYGISLQETRHILVTHDHADHVKAVGALSTGLALPVYSTRKVHDGIERNYCVKKKINPSRVRLIEKGQEFQVGEFQVTAFSVPHDSSDNVGYKIRCQGITFCLMTDVGHLTEEMLGYIGEANYLVLEANHDVEMLLRGTYPQYLKDRIMGQFGHLSNVDCAKALAENATGNLRHVWLCHLSEENNHPELARKTVEQTLRSYGIVAGKDFQVDVLRRKMPTGVFELT